MKRLAALLLAALSSSACQNQTGQQTTASAQTQEQQPEAQKPATESEEPAEEAEQPEQPEQAEQAEQSETQQAEQPEQAQTQQAENILIAYFSLGQNADYPEDVDATASASLVPGQDERVGTTEWIARLIQQNVGGQLQASCSGSRCPAPEAPVERRWRSRQWPQPRSRPPWPFSLSDSRFSRSGPWKPPFPWRSPACWSQARCVREPLPGGRPAEK
mgnify:CR=1 FL=1